METKVELRPAQKINFFWVVLLEFYEFSSEILLFALTVRSVWTTFHTIDGGAHIRHHLLKWPGFWSASPTAPQAICESGVDTAVNSPR